MTFLRHREKIRQKISYIDLIYLAVSALILYASSLQIINNIAPSIYETIHRQSVWHTISFVFLSRNKAKGVILILVSSQILLSFLICLDDKVKRRKVSILSAFLFIYLMTYMFFGQAEVLLLSSQLLSYFSLKKRISMSTYANFLLLLTSIFELFSLATWLIYPLFPAVLRSSFLSLLSYLDREIFYSLNALLGYPLLVFLVSSWALAFLMYYNIRVQQIKVERYKVMITLSNRKNVLKPGCDRAPELGNSTLFDTRLAFSVSLIVLLCLSFYSYSPAINPIGKLTNVDGIFYINALDKLEAVFNGTCEYEVFKDRYGGERLTSILLSLLIKNFLNISSPDAVKLSFFFASAFLVISSYVSLRLTFKDKSLESLSIYLTTFSTQVVVTLYAGYLAFCLAYSLLILMSALVISGVVKRKLKHLVLSVILSFLGLFTHPWSWFIYIVAIALFFMGLFAFSKTTSKSKIISLLLSISFVVLSFTMDFINKNLLGYLGGVQSDIPLICSMRLTNLFLFQRNAQYTLQLYVGGYLGNYIIFILSIIGIASLLGWKGKMSWFLVTFSLLTSAPIFFLPYDIQARLLYIMPLNIYSTLGCAEALKLAIKKGLNANFLLVLILLLLANYSFRSIANII